MNIGTVSEIFNAAGTSPIPVASTASVNTPSFPLHYGDAFGVEILLTSDGDAKVKVELEESMDDTNFVEPDGIADVASIEDENRHIVQLTPAPAKYGRFKLTGFGTNHSSTTVQLKLFKQEQM